MERLTLNIVTPAGALPPVECDSIHLAVADNGEEKGGGSYGIRPGHIQALLALERGGIAAFLRGEKIFFGESGAGFASVDHDVVTAVLEDFTQK